MPLGLLLAGGIKISKQKLGNGLFQQLVSAYFSLQHDNTVGNTDRCPAEANKWTLSFESVSGQGNSIEHITQRLMYINVYQP